MTVRALSASPVAATLSVPLRETQLHLAGPVLATTHGKVGRARCHLTLTCGGVTLQVEPHDNEPGRVLAVSLDELAAAMGAAVEREEAERLARMDPRRTQP